MGEELKRRKNNKEKEKSSVTLKKRAQRAALPCAAVGALRNVPEHRAQLGRPQQQPVPREGDRLCRRSGLLSLFRRDI